MPTKTIQDPGLKDPKPQEPKPDPEQKNVPYPGLTAELRQKPDYGEETYQGLGRLAGKAALITGADSGMVMQ